jgi:UDP-N-acetylmuramoyl-tripeptide--D-alanyl-D-alanine ligase
MPVFEPKILARWTAGTWTAAPSAALTGFQTDTRLLRPGQVFVALRTDKRDGHDFLAAALAAGAGAALVARADPAVALPQLVVADPLAAFQSIAREHRRTFRAPVVGISGSAGKTSTKNLLALLLGSEAGYVLATEGNLNNHLGVPLTLTRLDPSRHRFAVVEAGIGGPGEMGPLASMIEPDVAIITLVGHAHTQELGGLDGVAREKAVLPAAVRASGVAIFPRRCTDYPVFRDLGVRTMTVEPADVLRPAEPPRDRVYFTITQRDGSTAIALAYGRPPPLVFTLGRVTDGMARNAVLAICAALWLGVPRDVIQSRLDAYAPAPLRGEIRRDEGRLLYLDCYNANPSSMADALDTFRELAPAGQGPRLFVLGCMEELGADAFLHHENLGASLQLAPDDHVCVIGDQAAAVRRGALAAGARPDQVEIVGSLETMASRYAAFAGAVFVKGSRRYQLERILENGHAPVAH